ncbi:hypothetical protein CsSME_00010808 [Camellia sinensis var. sinensis]
MMSWIQLFPAILAEGKAILHWKAYYVGKVLGISFDLGVDVLDGGYNGCEGTWLRAWCVWGMFEWLLFL